MADSIGTRSDPAAQKWAIDDGVTQLRLWGIEIVYPLEAGQEPTIGASNACPIRIEDPSGQVSRTHARVVRTVSGWGVRDLESKNGVFIDGTRCKEGLLVPGTELGIGDVILIAESRQLIALRGFLARLAGPSRGGGSCLANSAFGHGSSRSVRVVWRRGPRADRA